MTGRRTWLGLVAAILMAALLWWSQGDGSTPTTEEPAASASVSDPGQPVVSLAELPPEAQDTVGLDHRGARRIVAGSAGELDWTEDHYASFERIKR